jgi:[ribosomal protein S18]-alanine N-acetyltransferase
MMALDRQNPGAAHWSRQQYEGLFANSETPLAQRVLLVAEESSEMQAETVSSAPHPLLAFLVASRVEKEWELENIVVDRKYQRLGIGTRLLGKFIDHTRANNHRSISLEVRESNQPARAMYRKIGFAETGSRKSYYSDPTENAILYLLNLI